RELEDVDHVAAARSRQAGRGQVRALDTDTAASADRDVLHAVHLVGHRVSRDDGAEDRFPQDLAGSGVEGTEPTVYVTDEDQAAAGRQDGHESSGLLVLPQQLACGGRVGLQGADVLFTGSEEGVEADAVQVLGHPLVRLPLGLHAEVVQALVDGVRVRVVGAGHPVAATESGGADQPVGLADRVGDHVLVDDDRAVPPDLRDHVLAHRRTRPQELARLAVEAVDDPRLARDVGEGLVDLARDHVRVDPRDLVRVGRDLDVHDHALERVVEVPVVTRQVLVVPDDLARVDVDGQRAVGVEDGVAGHSAENLGRGRRYGGAPEHEPELGVVGPDVAPGAYVEARLEREVTPGVAAGFPGSRDQERAPHLLAALAVVSGDVAATRQRGVAGAAADDLAVDDEGAGGLAHHARVTHAGFPDQLTGPRVEGDDVRVAGEEVDLVLVDGDAAHRVTERRDGGLIQLRDLATVVPDQVTG